MRLPEHVPTRARDFFPFPVTREQKIDHLDTRAECISAFTLMDGGAPFSNSKGVAWGYDKAYGDGSSYHFVTNSTVW
jgi:hypothetical protein